MKDYKRERVEHWLIKQQRFITISAIERELNFPKGTIQKFLKEGKSINKERVKSLFQFIKKHTQF